MLYINLRLIIATMLLLIIGGCQSLTIHVTTQGIKAERLEILRQSLSEVADEVVITELTIPKKFPNTVIAVNPAYVDYARLASIQDRLWSHNFGVATELRFAQGNHFYLKSNIGIYLRHPALQRVPMIPPYLRTQYCEFADATLMFNKDYTFQLEYENTEDIMGDLLTSAGVWQFNGQQLFLLDAKGEQLQKFELSRQTKDTQWGPKPADVYIAQHVSDFSPLNCEFLIIYVQESVT
ncbi:MAG: DUF5004 domain-containing protein [Aestuariibacter sp.]